MESRISHISSQTSFRNLKMKAHIFQKNYIYIEFPENAVGNVSDENSEDEDGGTVNNLPVGLLRSGYSPGADFTEVAIQNEPNTKI